MRLKKLKSKKQKALYFTLDAELIAKIDKARGRLGVTRKRFLVMCLEWVLSPVEAVAK